MLEGHSQSFTFLLLLPHVFRPQSKIIGLMSYVFSLISFALRLNKKSKI